MKPPEKAGSPGMAWDDSTEMVTAAHRPEGMVGGIEGATPKDLTVAVPEVRGNAATMPGQFAEEPARPTAPTMVSSVAATAPRGTPTPRPTPTPAARPTPTPSGASRVVPVGTDPYLDSIIADRYRIIRKLGEGGMGVVYLAEHVIIEKKVALKILFDDFARKTDLVQRFIQEAKAASKIGHENIVDITDFGETPSGAPFFSMEYLDGKDLAHHVRQGPMSFERSRLIITQICRALGAAHGKGIIHRDMKPENVFLVDREGRDDFVKVLDFGIAKMNSMEEGGARLTRTGMIFGTPEYMSPEQARGDRPDHRVDIYAVGCILYEMLSGDVPFHADTFMGVLTKHMFDQPEPLTVRAPHANVPPDVEAVVMKALTKDRDHRFQTMKEMSIALAACGGGSASEAWGNEPSQVIGLGEGTMSGLHQPRRSEAAVPVASATLTQEALSGAERRAATPRGNGKLIVGVLSAMVLAVGAVAVVLMGQTPASTPTETPPVVVAPPPEAPVRPTPPPPAQKSFKMTFKSKPSGADVFRGDELLGTTPATIEFVNGGKAIDLVVRKKSFKDYEIEVIADRERDFVFDLRADHTKGVKDPGRALPHLRDQPVATPVKPTAAPKQNAKLRDLKDPFSTGP
ncbi:MAG: serine/threonine protein kinase [Myxococcales bacterium]|nr:serine/threonine protein kinase [Myxococcales bacterium]